MAMVAMGSNGPKAWLLTQFYDDPKSQIYDIIRSTTKAEIQVVVATKMRIVASSVQVHFHDCFVNISECLAISYHARIYKIDEWIVVGVS